MTGLEYQELAMRSMRSDFSIDDMLMNGSMGLAGETGEVVDILKKYFWHGRSLDEEHILEELGDVMWYIAEICNALGYDVDEVMERNIEKLKKRWPSGFEF